MHEQFGANVAKLEQNLFVNICLPLTTENIILRCL